MPKSKINAVTWMCLSFTLLAIAIGVLATGAVRTQDLFLAQSSLFVAATLYLLGSLLKPAKPSWNPAIALALLFIGYAIYRTCTADLAYPANLELHRILTCGIALLILNQLVASQKMAMTAAAFLVGLAALAASYGVFQFVTKSQQIWWYTQPASYVGRASGPFICPNSLGGFLALILPLALALTIGGRISIVARIGFGYASLLILAGLGVSLSRGGWMAAAVGLTTLILLHLHYRQHRKRVLILGSALLVGGLIILGKSWVVRERIQSTVDKYHVGASLEIRLSLWRSAYSMWQDHFWFGVGPGHFDYRFPQYRENSVQARPLYAHNDYLNTLADWGVIGVSLLSLCLVATSYIGFRNLRSTRRENDDLRGSKGSNRWSITAGSLGGISALLAHSCVDFDIQIPGIALSVACLIALITGSSRSSSRTRKPESRTTLDLAPALIIILMCGFAGFGSLRNTLAARAIAKANTEKSHTPSRINALKEAITIQPQSFEARYALGEAYRQISWQGLDEYESYANEAIKEYSIAHQLNPFDPYPLVRTGMCLDWIDDHGKALGFYEAARALDPNNYYLSILSGWHHIQTGEYIDAQRWLLRSLQQKHWPNDQARSFYYKARRLHKESLATQQP